MSCEEKSLFSDARRRAADLSVQDLDCIEVQGIDYIEVLDHEALDEDLRRRILLIHCFDSLAPAKKINVHIEGGAESAPPRVQWALPASRMVSPGPADALWIVPGVNGEPRALTPEEIAFLAGWSSDDNLLIVHVSLQIAPDEDRSNYRATLVLGNSHGIDPRLATAGFALDAEGPLDVDCTPVSVLTNLRPAAPPIDYLAKDYTSFRRLMLDRMAVIMPEWTDRNAADIGVTLVELLAHAGDQLSYYQDAVATEAYLGTARRRTSVRRHARLFDYALHEGNNARVWISLEVNDDYRDYPALDGETPEDKAARLALDDARIVPAGTRLITRLENEPDTTLQDGEALPEALRQSALFFETLHPIRPRGIRNRIPLYDWGGGVTCVPRGATKATLAVDRTTLDLQAGDALVLEEVDDANTGLLADPTHRHAVCLIAVHDVVDMLVRNPSTGAIEARNVTEIVWHGDDALPFTLPLRHPSGTRAAVARGNVVLADHGRTIDHEPLLPDVAPASERYRPRLANTHVTHSVPDGLAALRACSAAAALVQDPRRALPAVQVFERMDFEGGGCTPEDENGTPWYPRRDLLASGPFDRHVALEVERDGRAQVRFGDNVNGRRPSAGSRWQATYRVGNGSAGNIGADAVAHVLVPMDASARSSVMLHGIEVVRNPLPAVGGMEPERGEQARLYAPYTFRQGERAVTADDYAEITERHPEVQKAVARIHWTGSWDTVFVTVDRIGGLSLDTPFENELRSFLEPFRMAGQDLEFAPPEFVPLDIALTVHVARDYLRGEVKAAVMDALGSGESTTGRRGFFHPDNFTFGDPVYLSHIVATAMRVPGVVWVDTDDRDGKPNRFQRFGEEPRGEIGKGVITLGPLEIIRVDNDPTAPQHGRIRLYMEGGL